MALLNRIKRHLQQWQRSRHQRFRRHAQGRRAALNNRHAAVNAFRAQRQPMPAGLDRHMGAAIDNHLLPGAKMDLLAGTEPLTGDANMSVALHPQVIVLFQFGQAIAVGQMVLIAVQFMAGNAANDDGALMVDLDPLVIEHKLNKITLRADGDLFSALSVLDAQLVVTATTGVLWLRQILRVCSAGRSSGTGVTALGKHPSTNGLSGSPSVNPTNTSMPTRGICTLPYWS